MLSKVFLKEFQKPKLKQNSFKNHQYTVLIWTPNKQGTRNGPNYD